ncbi:MAG TPA: Type 1 glutamine amidotransferase-like domain-containing protein [Gaiellaceae bacterium]|nr:Type 1 glutamine amidotransferase-like domain-containing protein [Gaiellaceae bacterium]
MKLLLTSAGIKNPSIRAALIELLGKPIEDCDALCIPTASYGHYSFAGAWRFLNGVALTPMLELGWKSLGVLEVAALASLDREVWLPQVQEADVLLANGGDALFLAHHMRESGLADLLPSLNPVWCGLSAGSMVMTPRIGEDFKRWDPPGGGDETLGLVNFSFFPHLAPDGEPGNSMAEAEEWLSRIDNPAYVVDDQTAIKWVDGEVEVVSEGEWHFFEPVVN